MPEDWGSVNACRSRLLLPSIPTLGPNFELLHQDHYPGPLPDALPLSWGGCVKLAGGDQKRAIYPQPDPEQADSPEIRCQPLPPSTTVYPPRARARAHSHTCTPRSSPRCLPSRRLILPSQYKLDTSNCAGPEGGAPVANRCPSHSQPFSPLSCSACTPSRHRHSQKVPRRSRNSDEKLPICPFVQIGYPLALLAPLVPSGPSRALYGISLATETWDKHLGRAACVTGKVTSDPARKVVRDNDRPSRSSPSISNPYVGDPSSLPSTFSTRPVFIPSPPVRFGLVCCFHPGTPTHPLPQNPAMRS
jgi:hypothetical protein